MAAWIQRLVDAPDKPILTKAEVADLFGYESEDSVDNMVKAGQMLRPSKRGATSVWDWEEIVFVRLLIKYRDRLEETKSAEKAGK